MTKKLRLASLVAALAGTMGFGQVAVAQPVMCSTVDSLSEWSTVQACVQGDKEWTFGSSALLAAGGDAQTIFSIVESATADFYRLQLSVFDNNDGAIPNISDNGFILGPVADLVAYTIAIIDDAATPEDERMTRYFVSAAVDSDTVSIGNRVQKDGTGYRDIYVDGIFDETILGDTFSLVSLNGSKDVKSCSSCLPNRIEVTSLDVTSATGGIQVISDEYEQAVIPIPEPGTIALFGVGLLGAGFAARRRKA